MLGFNIQERLEKFKVSLLQYGEQIALHNADNRNDEAKRAETFYQGVLSRLFSINLINLNYATALNGQQNTFTAGIDLLDIQTGSAIQITSIRDNRNQKVHDTLTKTADRKAKNMPFYANVNHLLVLFIAHDHSSPTVARDADMQLADEHGMTLTVKSISEILDYIANSYPTNNESLTRLLSAIEFAETYHHPGRGQPPIHSQEHHEKLALGKDFQAEVDHLTLTKAYHLRAIEHYRAIEASKLNIGSYRYGMHVPHGYHNTIGAEALCSNNHLVRFWCVDILFLDNLTRFIRGWRVAPRSNTPLFCDIPDLGLIEKDIYSICKRIIDMRTHLEAFSLPPYHISPAISVGKRPSVLATFEGQMRPENQAYGFIVQHPEWFMNETDERALQIAQSSGPGLQQLFEQWRQYARETDALIETLSARVDDHGALIGYHSGRDVSLGFDMNQPFR